MLKDVRAKSVILEMEGLYSFYYKINPLSKTKKKEGKKDSGWWYAILDRCWILLDFEISNRKFFSQTKTFIRIRKCWLISDFIWILKPQIKNSWVRYKQLPESENSHTDFQNQISDIHLEKLPYIYYNFIRTIYMLFAVPC